MGPELLHANVVNYNENKFQWAFFSVGFWMEPLLNLLWPVTGLLEHPTTQQRISQTPPCSIPEHFQKSWIQRTSHYPVVFIILTLVVTALMYMTMNIWSTDQLINRNQQPPKASPLHVNLAHFGRPPIAHTIDKSITVTSLTHKIVTT